MIKKDKWFYVELIRNYSDSNCSLMDLLDTYDKIGLIQISDEEAKEYWENHKPN